MAYHNNIGQKGEQLARNYLKSEGYNIVETNWRFQHKEIDIIAEKDSQLVFVEVKLRSSERYGNPEEAVNHRKQKLLIEAADQYLQGLEKEYNVRFDVISIIKNSDREVIKHIEEAFLPGLDLE